MANALDDVRETKTGLLRLPRDNDPHRAHLTHQKAVCVAVSRARDGVTIVTDDATLLKDTLERQTGEKIDAIDIEASREQAADEPVLADDDKARETKAGIEPVTVGYQGRPAIDHGELAIKPDELEVEMDVEIDREMDYEICQ